MSRARTTPQMSRCTHGFRLQITLLNLSHRVPTPSVEPGTLPMDLLLQLENTYGQRSFVAHPSTMLTTVSGLFCAAVHAAGHRTMFSGAAGSS